VSKVAVAVITALERELQPWVGGWKQVVLSQDGGSGLKGYEKDSIIAVAGGIGCARSEEAARTVVRKYQPQVLISAGLAGALVRSLKVGNVITPNVIVDAASGTEYRSASGAEIVGGGILVSAGEIAESEEARAGLVERFHALAVDMEAAGVARVAQQEQIAFRCVKAISDEADFKMPPLNNFMDAEGDFRTGKFVGWVSVRPWHWGRTIALARHTKRATKTLCDWLARNIPTTQS
jgi:adenosylhomocysteine nucleosidase